MQSLPIYIFSFLLVLKLFKTDNYLDAVPLNMRVVIMFLIILLSQLIMILYSHSITDKKLFTSGLTTGPVNAFLFIGNFLLMYILVFSTINSLKKEKLFLKSLIVTISVLFVLVLLPQIFGTFTTIFDKWTNLIGSLFEATHRGREDFYANGSYATTLRRVNGFEKEASFLAAKVGIIFIPPILAAIKNQYNLVTDRVNDKIYLYWILLSAMVLTLFFAKTSTGFIVIGLIIITLFWAIPKNKLWVLLTGLFITLLGVIILYMVSPYVHFMLNKYILEKSGTDNRLGGTIALFRTFFHYPLFGVGAGYTSFYNFKFVPEWTTHNYEFQEIFSKTGYPDQSVLGSWFASYGLVGIVPAFIYIKNKIVLSRTIKHNLASLDKNNAKFIATVIDSFYIYLIYVLVLSVFTLSWTDEIYLLVFMFYIHSINQASVSV